MHCRNRRSVQDREWWGNPAIFGGDPDPRRSRQLGGIPRVTGDDVAFQRRQRFIRRRPRCQGSQVLAERRSFQLAGRVLCLRAAAPQAVDC